MTFEELLSRAAEPTLQRMVGRAGVRLLSRLDPGLTRPEKLREIALGINTPQEMLLDPTTRTELLDLLPPAVAEDLAETLGISANGAPYAALGSARISRGSRRQEKLLDFFALPEPVVEEIVRPPAVSETAPDHGLFAHQRIAARRVLAALGRDPHRVLLHMPTGSGKTRTAMYVLSELMNEHEPFLAVWLAHSEELCEQAVEEFTASWRALGNRPLTVYRWWGEHDPAIPNDAEGLVVAGLAKAHSSLTRSISAVGRLAGRANVVVMDEAHQAVAPTYQDLLEVLTQSGNQSGLLGLTATPGRTWNDIDEDERLAELFFKNKVPLEVPGYSSPIDYLVDRGYLAQTEFVSLNYTSGTELTDRDLRDLASSLDIPNRIIEQLAGDEQRNLVIINRTEAMLRRHNRLLIFAATVQHARLIATVLRARGHRASAVTGETPGAERARLIADFKSDDDYPVALVNFGVLTTGFDAPRTSGAIIARPTRSLVLYSQMVGRAIRGPRAGGNERAEVVTVVDTALPGFSSVAEAFNNWEDVWRQAP